MTLYHPTNLEAAKEAASANLRSRVEAFLFILSSGRISEFPLSVISSEQIIKTMDAGTDTRFNRISTKTLAMALFQTV